MIDLKNIIAKKPARELYWALVLEPGWVQAGIWEIVGEKVEVVSISPSTPWETDDELLGAVDTALSAGIQKIPEEINEPTNAVFGVPASWVTEGQIKQEYLDKIRIICTKLSLNPSGFVVLGEAIAHLCKHNEGTPLNAIVLGFGEESLELSFFNLGNLVGTTKIARSVSVADDVLEGLARFSHMDLLPSRFIIYDGKGGDLEDIRQALLDTQWEDKKKVKFLHTPKVEILESEKKVIATSLAGASEISGVSSIKEVQKQTDQEKPSKEEENIKLPEKEDISAEELGFVIGEDITAKVSQNKTAPIKDKEEIPLTAAVGSKTKPKILSFLGRFPQVVRGLFSKLPKPQANAGYNLNQKSQGKIFILGAIFLLIFFVAGILYWWFYPKADIVIYVSPKTIEEEISLSVDLQASQPDFSKSTIPGALVETTVSGEKTKSATGTKTVGEKAKGSVKIQNGTSSVVNLPAGTILTASNDLRFSTTASASISAALSPSSPGTANVDVVAADIGAQYNLAKDESYKVANYPKADIDAVSLADFSGGTSRQISAVSEDDQTSLEKDLEDELLGQAKSKLESEVATGRVLIAGSLSSSISSQDYSAKVGDEASNLKLALKLTIKGVSVEEQTLFDYLKEVLKNKVPSGYVLRDEQLSENFQINEVEDSIYLFDVSASANLLPEIKPEQIIGKIRGKYPEVAEDYLKTVPGYVRTEIKLKPRFPGKLGTLPRVAKNISVDISAEQ